MTFQIMFRGPDYNAFAFDCQGLKFCQIIEDWIAAGCPTKWDIK